MIPDVRKLAECPCKIDRGHAKIRQGKVHFEEQQHHQSSITNILSRYLLLAWRLHFDPSITKPSLRLNSRLTPNMRPQPSALIIPAVKRHTATVIMAHGLGDSGAGWVSLAENWRRRSKFDEVKFIFPNAPAIPITVVSACFVELVQLSTNIS